MSMFRCVSGTEQKIAPFLLAWPSTARQAEKSRALIRAHGKCFDVEDFTAGAIHDQPARRLWTVDPPFDERVKALIRDWGANKNPELIEEMIVTALKMARDDMGVAD